MNFMGGSNQMNMMNTFGMPNNQLQNPTDAGGFRNVYGIIG